MFEIRVESSFSAAHNLKNYRGKCENLHGHNWRVEASFAFDALDKDGMAVDFKIAKKLLNDALKEMDHAYLNKLKALSGINPTSENIAKFIYDRIKNKNRAVNSVSVWENENSRATYTEGCC